MNAQIMRAHGGTAVHCAHRAAGYCRHCEPPLHVLIDRDDGWQFPDAGSLVAAMRANSIATRGGEHVGRE